MNKEAGNAGLNATIGTFHKESSQESSQPVFTRDLLARFLQSRPQGISHRTAEAYHYTLTGFIGYPTSPEGISQYLSSLSCHNGKLKFFTCLKTLCSWLWQNGFLPDNPIKRVSPPRIQKKLLPAISKEQLEALLNHCHCER